MTFELITYQSTAYNEMVTVRHKVLREPLGLTFTPADLQKDEHDLLLVARFSEGAEIIGCCILTPLNEHTAQLRQMAVAPFMQAKGVGCQLLDFAEQVATERHYIYIYLHARKVAVGFYQKQGYTIEGSEFEEVGIPHFEMLKKIVS